MPEPILSRRAFLRGAALAATTTFISACAAVNRSSPTQEPASKMPRRVLGKTGIHLSVVGFGGIVVMNETVDTARDLVAQAIARGINYFDVAPSYGNAQERLGPALEPYRKDVFLACKTSKRDKAGAEADLSRSLELLRTDHFDLYQLHGIASLAEAERVLAPDGALQAVLAAREKGLVRLIGFSAHSEAAALVLLDRFAFDSILYPVNWVCWYKGRFGPEVIAKAEQKGMGILALKALAKRSLSGAESKKWPKCWYVPVDTPDEVALGLRFTLSRPVTAAVSPSHAELLWLACDAAEKLTPLSPQEEEQLAQQSQALDPVFRA